MKRQPVIDADGHLLERQSDIRKYLEPPWDRRTTALFPTGAPWNRDLFGTLGYPEMHGRSPEEQVETWLQIMDREDIEKAVVFPSSAANVIGLPEPAFSAAVARAANTHLAKDYGSRTPRLRPVGVLPLRDPQAAAVELRRAVTDLGLVSFELCSLGVPLGLGDPFFDPVYAEAERLGVPLCYHVGAGGGPHHDLGGDRFKSFIELHTFNTSATVFIAFVSVMFNAVPVRFTKLKLAFLEAGATWLPYYLDRMDEHWELRGKFEAPLLIKKPSDVFRESPIYVSLEADETLLGQTVDYLGDDHFLFASDFPHWDARFPHNLEELEGRHDLSEKSKRKILYENAKALFGL